MFSNHLLRRHQLRVQNRRAGGAANGVVAQDHETMFKFSAVKKVTARAV
jgi:hypothetical protein